VNRGKQTKIKYRFNVIDIILLCVIAISLFSIVFLVFYKGDGNLSEKSDSTVEIVYTVKQTEIPDILRGKINMGDSAVLSDNQKTMGQVIDFQYTDSIYKYIDPSTELTSQMVYPGKIDVSVKISATATKSEDGIYRVNGQLVNVGEEIDLRFPFYTGKMVCVSVSEVSE
jgi:hypothetical protein